MQIGHSFTQPLSPIKFDNDLSKLLQSHMMEEAASELQSKTTIDFQTQVVKMSSKDKHLVTQLTEGVANQKYNYQKKKNLHDALQKNMAIL